MEADVDRGLDDGGGYEYKELDHVVFPPKSKEGIPRIARTPKSGTPAWSSRTVVSIQVGTAFSVFFLVSLRQGLRNEPICKLFRIVTSAQVFAD